MEGRGTRQLRSWECANGPGLAAPPEPLRLHQRRSWEKHRPRAETPKVRSDDRSLGKRTRKKPRAELPQYQPALPPRAIRFCTHRRDGKGAPGARLQREASRTLRSSSAASAAVQLRERLSPSLPRPVVPSSAWSRDRSLRPRARLASSSPAFAASRFAPLAGCVGRLGGLHQPLLYSSPCAAGRGRECGTGRAASSRRQGGRRRRGDRRGGDRSRRGGRRDFPRAEQGGSPARSRQAPLSPTFSPPPKTQVQSEWKQKPEHVQNASF